MSVNELRDFIFEKYYKRIGLVKEKSYYSLKRLKKKRFVVASTKLIEKIPDPRNAKEHYQSFIRKKTKSVKQSQIITKGASAYCVITERRRGGGALHSTWWKFSTLWKFSLHIVYIFKKA